MARVLLAICPCHQHAKFTVYDTDVDNHTTVHAEQFVCSQEAALEWLREQVAAGQLGSEVRAKFMRDLRERRLPRHQEMATMRLHRIAVRVPATVELVEWRAIFLAQLLDITGYSPDRCADTRVLSPRTIEKIYLRMRLAGIPDQQVQQMDRTGEVRPFRSIHLPEPTHYLAFEIALPIALPASVIALVLTLTLETLLQTH